MRKVFEKVNVYIYFVIPFLVCLIYYFLMISNLLNLQAIDNYNNHKFDFVVTLLGTLLTIYGFMMMLPENKFRKALRIYKHDEIINNTIFIGILSSLIFILMYLIGYESWLHDLFFLVTISETTIATIKIFKILRYSAKSVS
ncbi:hypothetical protein ACQV2R_05120 [Facklamia sp. P12937]|uniref:hypothetical protein n=1 Tax=Facklamia sp. P12937 TaxID=3421949 RepID=UPI003D182C9C